MHFSDLGDQRKRRQTCFAPRTVALDMMSDTDSDEVISSQDLSKESLSNANSHAEPPVVPGSALIKQMTKWWQKKMPVTEPISPLVLQK